MNVARTSHLTVALKLVFTLVFSGLLCLSAFFSPLQAQTVLFSENFDAWTGVSGCPPNWTCPAPSGCTAGASCSWNRNDTFGPLNQPSLTGCDSTTYYARCNTENLTSGILPSMITPAIDLSSYPLSDSLKFSFCYINSSTVPNDGDGILVSFSSDGGSTWGLQFFDLSTVYNSWTTIQLEIPLFYKTAQFKVKIEGSGNGSTGDIGIDEIRLTQSAFTCSSFSATAVISSDYNGEDISCFGESDGSVKAITIGGQAPYSYSWSNGQSLNEATNLPSGLVSVTVTDANGCQATAAITISEPELMEITLIKPPTISGYDISCFGAATGIATAFVSGGTAPFSYVWNDGQQTATATQLTAGVQTLLVTDNNGCFQSQTISLVQAPPLTLTLATTTSFNGFDISCSEAADGAVEATATGGIAPYSYSWSTGDDTPTLGNLSAGNYSLILTDTGGCTDSAQIELTGPEAMELILTASPASCADTGDGSISSSLSGGTSPYTYRWSNENTQANLNFATAGEYRLRATDINGCQISTAATVEAPSALEAEAMIVHPTCYGEANGFIGLSVSGGEGPYSFAWSHGETSQDLFDISAGQYAVTITDAAGCEKSTPYFLEDPDPLDVQAIITSDDGTGIGTVKLIVKGGKAPYQYNWGHSARETTPQADSLPVGSYSVTVVDANGCSSKLNIEIEATRQLNCLQIHTGFTPNGDGVNELWHIPCLPTFADNQLIILNRWGQQILQIEGYQNEWDGNINGSPLPDGTYYYILKLDGPVDKRVFRGTVTIIR